MGQPIKINSTTTIDRVLVIDSDRTLAGQDGEVFNGPEAARRGATFPAKLAVELFESDENIDHVFVMSNAVSVRRLAPWDEDAVTSATTVVANFFLFYKETVPAGK